MRKTHFGYFEWKEASLEHKSLNIFPTKDVQVQCTWCFREKNDFISTTGLSCVYVASKIHPTMLGIYNSRFKGIEHVSVHLKQKNMFSYK